MALDAHYITDGPLEEYFVDKDTGLPLAGGTLTFYEDSSRITPKPVYELTGAPPNYQYVALPNPITLSSVGTVQNNAGDNVVIYYYPWLPDGITPDLYYVVCEDSNGVQQFTREGWPNGIVASGGGEVSTLPVQNQISNPQFTRILINDVPGLTPATTVYTVSAANNQPFAFAPDWTFLITGTGTVTVSRVAIAGSAQVPTSPPYVIEVTVSAGISACYLSQRFYTNSGLWASTASDSIFLSTSIMARNEQGLDTSIQMYYSPSLPANTLIPIFDELIPASTPYAVYTGSSEVPLPVSTDTNTGTAGYVDIYISFPQSSQIRISSVQVVPTFDAESAGTFAYDEVSANRDQALLGSYYIPRNVRSPIPSLLTGWDFPLNPAQLGSSQTINFGTPNYVWDQLICNSIVGNVAVTRNTQTGGLTLTPAASNDAMYLLQYLTGAQAKEMLYTRLSSNISTWLTATAGVVTLRAYLFTGSSSATIPILSSTIGNTDNLGNFTLSASNWTPVPRSGLDTARAQVQAVAPTVLNDIQFTGWEITDNTVLSDTNKFAMVVTLAWTTPPVININSISLNKGDLPTRPAPQTASDVLSECQYYYEQTYNAGVLPGAVSTLGQQFAIQGSAPTTDGSHTEVALRSFGINYKISKRTAPTVTLYSPATLNASGTVSLTFSYRGAIKAGYPQDITVGTSGAGWTQTGNGNFGTSYISNATAVVQNYGSVQDGTDETYILYHYTADCRLGIIA